MVDLVGKIGLVFVKQAILTASTGAVRNQTPQGDAYVTAQAA